jgi:hypothetical protein
MYLFDTDTLSNIVKQKSSERLLEKLEETPNLRRMVSAAVSLTSELLPWQFKIVLR